MVNPEPDKNLEQILHRQLRALPDLAAPEQLLPNVLRQLTAPPALAWWRRPWIAWPQAMQIISALTLVGMLGGISLIAPLLYVGMSDLAGQVTQSSPLLKVLVRHGVSLLDELQSVDYVALAPWLVAGAFLIAVLYLSVAVLGTLFHRMIAEQKPNF